VITNIELLVLSSSLLAYLRSLQYLILTEGSGDLVVLFSGDSESEKSANKTKQ